MRKILLFMGSILVIAMLGTLTYFYYFFNLLGDCSEEKFLTKQLTVQKEVIGMLQNCGATTDFATTYRIIESGKTSEPILALKGDWSNKCTIEFEKNTLNVTCQNIPNSNIFSTMNSYHGIKINLQKTKK